MSKFGDLIKGKASVPAPAPVVEAPKRARGDDGHFIADDPSTPENEAWVGGVSPSKKKTKKRKSAQS